MEMLVGYVSVIVEMKLLYMAAGFAVAQQNHVDVICASLHLNDVHLI